MLPKYIKRLFILSSVSLFLAIPVSGMAQTGDWQFKLALYGWVASIGGEAATGTEIIYDSEDLMAPQH
jgi:hypothetical protein